MSAPERSDARRDAPRHPAHDRWAWVEVDLTAIQHNAAWLRRTVAPAEVWAVVKADGYGHGALPVAQAALGGGATGLGVALVHEGAALRAGGLDAPVLLLSQPPLAEMDDVVALRLRPTVDTPAGIDAAAAAAGRVGGEPLAVHLKLDTGMHRVGADPREAVALAQRILGHRALRLDGVFTHLAVADDPAHRATAEQLGRFDAALAQLRGHGIEPPLVHAANSAGAILRPDARRSLVRTGIALYGIPPAPSMAAVSAPLRPALALKARVSHVKVVHKGEGVSYGLRHTFERDTVVATLPLGYADGVPRRLFGTGGEVLVGGSRRPIVGVVTMDQLMVDCGPTSSVGVGDEVVLIGEQGGERITPDEWAQRLGTISYEIVCGISGRVPRRLSGRASASAPTGVSRGPSEGGR